MSKEMKSVNITSAMFDTTSLDRQGTNGTINASIETMAELDRLFDEVTASVKDATQARRRARAAVGRAEAANSLQVALQAEFLHFVGEHCPEVANWDIWPLPPRRDESGDIILETPIDADMLRSSAQVMHRSIQDNTNAILNNPNSPKDNTNFGGMFGGDSEQ